MQAGNGFQGFPVMSMGLDVVQSSPLSVYGVTVAQVCIRVWRGGCGKQPCYGVAMGAAGYAYLYNTLVSYFVSMEGVCMMLNNA